MNQKSDILMTRKVDIPTKVGDGHSESRVTNVSLSKSNHQRSGHSVRGYTSHINTKHSADIVGSTIGYTASKAVFLLCRYEWIRLQTKLQKANSIKKRKLLNLWR